MPASPEPTAMKRRALAVPVALLLLGSALMAPERAAAAEGEHEYGVAGGGGLATTGPPFYARAGAQYLYNVRDLWSLGAVVYGGVDSAAEPRFGAFAETRIIIDALQWVPSLTVGAGVHDLDLALRVTGEIAWRPTRDGAFFARLTSEFGGIPPLTGVEVGYRFIRGAASDLDF